MSQGNDSSRESYNAGSRESYNIGSRKSYNTDSRESWKCDHGVRKCVGGRSIIGLPIISFPRESVVGVHMESGSVTGV